METYHMGTHPGKRLTDTDTQTNKNTTSLSVKIEKQFDTLTEEFCYSCMNNHRH